jgi:hypothetical protein
MLCIRCEKSSTFSSWKAYSRSHISINWRAKPLTSLEVVLELLSHTKTKEGLAVFALKESNIYPTGIKVSDEELASLNLSRNSFHGDWNYTIKPQDF